MRSGESIRGTGGSGPNALLRHIERALVAIGLDGGGLELERLGDQVRAALVVLHRLHRRVDVLRAQGAVPGRGCQDSKGETGMGGHAQPPLAGVAMPRACANIKPCSGIAGARTSTSPLWMSSIACE